VLLHLVSLCLSAKTTKNFSFKQTKEFQSKKQLASANCNLISKRTVGLNLLDTPHRIELWRRRVNSRFFSLIKNLSIHKNYVDQCQTLHSSFNRHCVTPFSIKRIFLLSTNFSPFQLVNIDYVKLVHELQIRYWIDAYIVVTKLSPMFHYFI